MCRGDPRWLWAAMIIDRYGRLLIQEPNGLNGCPASNIVVQIVLPIVLSFALTAFGFVIKEFDGFVTCVSIITAIMCAISVLLFQIRVRDVREDRRLTRLDLCYIDDLFTLSVWSMVVGLLLAVIVIAPKFACIDAILLSCDSSLLEAIPHTYHFVVYLLSAHLIAVVLIFANRFVGVYERVAERKGGNGA